MSKDLDFDELDKAVSSLMGGVKDKDADTREKNLDINSTLGPDENPTYTHLDEAAEGIGSETIDKHEQTVSLNDKPEASAPTSSKRGGRFMDLIHKSSDMRTASPSDSSSKTISREGVSIAAPIDDKDDKEAPQVTTEGNLPPSSSDSLPQDDEETESELTPEKIIPPEPLSSPFLPGAKVEKRPLGGEPKIEPEAIEESEVKNSFDLPDISDDKKPEEHDDDSEKLENKDDEFSKMDAMAEPAQNLGEVNEHIPEEYKNELLAVEQNIAAPLPGEAEDDDHHSNKEEDSGKLTVEAPVLASIPKQYQEQPSSVESTNGAIYDTDQYHKPLAHPAKEKSGWMWVLVIVILIMVGAALGAAAYFFGLV